MIKTNDRIRRISAGVLAAVLAATGIGLVHSQAVRAADLSFVKGVIVPYVETESLADDIEAPYNAENYRASTAAVNKYYYAGKPFALLRTENEGNTDYLMAQSAEWGTSEWNTADDGNPTYIINKTKDAVEALADDKEEALAVTTEVSNHKDGGDYGYRITDDDSKRIAVNAKYYPIAVGDVVVNNSGTPTVKSENADTIAVPNVNYWTRTAYNNESAHYVTSTGAVVPTAGTGGTEDVINPSTDVHYRGTANYIIPAFRADMTKVFAELPAIEYPNDSDSYLEPSYTLKRYFIDDPSDTHNKVKFLIKSTADNTLNARIGNSEITNIYENGAILIDYAGATLPSDDHPKFVSAMIFDKNGIAKYYGRLDTVTTRKGVVQLNTPSELVANENDTYTLALFEETDYGQYATGGMSEPIFAQFKVKPARDDLGITITSSDEHVRNINNDASGTTPLYFGGEQFYFGQKNADNTVMLIAKDPTKWGSTMAWDADAIIEAMKNNITSHAFIPAEENLIEQVPVYLGKSADTTNDYAPEDTLQMYPLTRTMIEDIKAGTPGTAVFSRGTGYWTGSYRNTSKAYFIDETGEMQEAAKTENKYVLPAFNLDVSGIVAEVEYKGERSANVSYSNEPRAYDISSHTDGARFILKDDDFNKDINFVTSVLEEEYNAGQEFTIGYNQASDLSAPVSSDAQSAVYVDAIIYDAETDEILYFGRLDRLTNTEDHINVKIPSGIPRGEYRLAFIAEKVNGDGQSNISTDPAKAMINIKVVTKDPTGMHTISSPDTGSINKPDPGIKDDGVKDALNESVAVADTIKFDGDHEFIVYNKNNDGTVLALLKDGKTATSETMWAQDASHLSDGQSILDITITDFKLTGFNKVEKNAMLPVDIDTEDKNNTGSGSRTGAKLFVPSYTELKAPDDYVGTGTTDTNVTLGYDTKYDILRAAGASANELLWTRSYAGDNNAYLITSIYTMNGTTDYKNTQQSFHYIPAAKLDIFGSAFMAGDATEGKYGAVSPMPRSYDLSSFGDQVKPYYVTDRLSISFNGLNNNIRNGQEGVTYTIPYTGATTDSNGELYISAVIYEINSTEYSTNTGKGDIKYYGKLARLNSASGDFEFTIPTELDSSNNKYLVAFFEEEANDPFASNFITEPVYLRIDNLNSNWKYFYEIAEAGGITFDNATMSAAREEAIAVKDTGNNSLAVFVPHAVVVDERLGSDPNVPSTYYTVRFYTDEKCTVPTPTYRTVDSHNYTIETFEEGTHVPLVPGTYYAKFNLTEAGKSAGIYHDGDDPTIVPFYLTNAIDLSGNNVKIYIGGEDYSGDKDLKLSVSYNDGKAIKPPVIVKMDDVPLKSLEDVVATSDPEDYTVTYTDNTEASKDGKYATVTIKGVHAYSGTIVKHFVIKPKDMSSCISVNNAAAEYDGTAKTLNLQITNTEIAKDATISMSVNGTAFTGATNAGVYNIDWRVTHPDYDVVTGTNTLTITARDASGAVITLDKDTYPYTGSPITPVIKSISVDDIPVTEADYTFAGWTNNTEVGTNTATGTFTFKRNFTGTATKTFSIAKTSISELGEFTCASQTYDGTNKVPVVKLDGVNISTEDYTITYKDSKGTTVTSMKDAGTYTVTVASKSPSIDGTVDVEFVIEPIEVIDGTNLTISMKTSVQYTGVSVNNAVLSVSVKTEDASGSVTLTEGTDYTVAYTDNVDAGTAKATITFKGNYHSAAPVEKTFLISAGEIQPGTVETIDNATYNGTQYLPGIECESPEGVIISYAVKKLGESDAPGVRPAESAFIESIPSDTLIDAGKYEVWYKMSKTNYEDVYGYTNVVIVPKNIDSDINIGDGNTDFNYTVDGMPHPFTEDLISLTGDAVGAVKSYSASENGTYTGTIPTYEGAGEYTDVGTYDVWIKFTKPNHTATPVHVRVIIHPETEIPYPTISGNKSNIVYDGQKHYITATTTVPDATVWYSSTGSESSYTTEPIGFDETGTHNVYIRVTAPGKETLETTASLTIKEATMEVKAIGYSGPYDSNRHGITFEFTNPSTSSKANILYSETYDENGTGYSDIPPFKTNANKYTIYYRISQAGYKTITNGSVTIDIWALDTAAEGYGYDGAWDGEYHSPTVIVTVPTSNYTISYSVNDGPWTEEVPRFKDPNTNVVVKWLVQENDGNYKPLENEVVIKIGPRMDTEITNLDNTKDVNEAIQDVLENSTSSRVTIGADVPAGVTGEAFKNADNVQSIVVEEGNPYYSSANGVLYDKTGNTIIAVPNGKSLNSDMVDTILEDVKVIGEGAFENCENLTGTLNIPDSVTEIKDDAFKDTGITKVVIPESVTKIGSGAFEDDTSLKVVTIKGDPEIKPGAFTGSGLTSTVYANNGKTLAYVPANVQAEDGTFIINSEKLDKVAGGALKDNNNINTIKVAGKDTVEIDPDAVGNNVTIKVLPSMYEPMMSANPSYMGQIVEDPIKMAEAEVDLNEENRTYKIGTDGTMPTPEISSITADDGTVLIEGVDYTVEDYTYDLTKGTITIIGKGDCTGTIEKTFQFTKTGSLIVDTASTMEGDEFSGDNGSSGVHTDKTTLRNVLGDSVDATTKTEATTTNVVVRMEYDEDVSNVDKNKIDNLLENNGYDNIARLFGLSIYTEDEGGNKEYISETASPIMFEVEIPEAHRNQGSYGILTVHNGTASEIASTTVGNVVKFKNDKFSSFALVNAAPGIDENLFTATLPAASYTYTGAAITPAVSVKYNGAALTEGTDYEVAYTNNTAVGMATVTVTGKGDYAGINRTLNFEITANAIDPALFTATIPSTTYPYTGAEITPEVTVKYNGADLVKGTDYTVAYSNNINKGTATITVTGKGDYAGITRTLNFTVGSAIGDLTNVTSTLVGTSEYVYTTTAITPDVYVKDGNALLTQGTDYTLYYQDNVDTGTAKVIVSGTNNYVGYRKELAFTIVPKNISSSDVKVSGIDDEKKYTGNNITQSPTLKYKNKKLKKGTDYTITYTNNKKVGTATMTITGINNYTGTLEYDFEIVESDESTTTSSKDAIKNLSNIKLTEDGRLPVAVSGNLGLTNAKVTSGGTSAYGRSPKTNDEGTFPVVLGIILIMISVAAAGVLLVTRKDKAR